MFSKILLIIFSFITLLSNLRLFSSHLLLLFDVRVLVEKFDNLFFFSPALDFPFFDLTGFCLEHSVSETIFLLSSFIFFLIKVSLVFCSYARKGSLNKHYDINIYFLSNFICQIVILKLTDLKQ